MCIDTTQLTHVRQTSGQILEHKCDQVTSNKSSESQRAGENLSDDTVQEEEALPLFLSVRGMNVRHLVEIRPNHGPGMCGPLSNPQPSPDLWLWSSCPPRGTLWTPAFPCTLATWLHLLVCLSYSFVSCGPLYTNTAQLRPPMSSGFPRDSGPSLAQATQQTCPLSRGLPSPIRSDPQPQGRGTPDQVCPFLSSLAQL